MARSKGTGTLIKRGKYWQCRLIVDGKIHYKSTGTTSKVEAKKMLDEFARPFQAKSDIEKLENIEARIHVMESGLSDVEDDYSNVKLAEILDKYHGMANAKAVTDSTLKNQASMLGRFMKFLKESKSDAVSAKDVDKPLVERFLASLKTSVCAGVYNNTIAMFKAVWSEFGRVSRHRCFRTNPWAGYKYRGADEPVKRPLTSDEIKKVFASIRDPDMRLLFKTGLYTGMRLGDCCRLRWDEIDMDRRLLNVEPIKTRRYHTKVVIPIHCELYAELLARSRSLTDGTEDPYVCRRLAKIYDAGNIGRIIRGVFEDAGVKARTDTGRIEVSFHSIRHCFVSMASSSGVPMDVIRQIVGHASTSMTEHYSHASVEALSKAVNAIPDIGAKTSSKVLVEVDAEVLKAVNSIGLTVEDALKELVELRKNTITVTPAA